MNVAVGLAEGRQRFRIAIDGVYRSSSGELFPSGEYEIARPIAMSPSGANTDSFIVEDVTIGLGFHWQRNQRQAFRGGFRVLERPAGLTLVNDVEMETYVESVIASEMSAESPLELLKTHAVIARSWLVSQIRSEGGAYRSERQLADTEWEIRCWYGRESHTDFDVCADDHCQRYQGLVRSGAASQAVRETAQQFVVFDSGICDARFSKCCGGVTEDYRTSWDDRTVPYLIPVGDGPGGIPQVDAQWIRGRPEAYCDTTDTELLSQILPGFDQETTDFYRWQVAYSKQDLAELVCRRTGLDLGEDLRLEPLVRGVSGRIVNLRIEGTAGVLTVGKELEIRRVLSPSHLYSSAFVVDHDSHGVRLSGAGWGHGVGLCQIGAGVMAAGGSSYRDILSHYYPETSVEMCGEESLS